MSDRSSTEQGWRSLRLNEVADRLDLGADLVDRMAFLPRSDGPQMLLPDTARAEQLMVSLTVKPEDRASTLAARPDAADEPTLWWLLNESFRVLLTQMGHRRPGNPGWAVLPDATGAMGRHLFVWAFLAAAPYVMDYHAAIGLTEEESWSTLGALGAELASSRELTGRPGLDSTWGLPMIFTGVSFRLGRLAFDRQPRQPPGAKHSFLRAGESGLNTHVPADPAPLTPEACDASFRRALELSEQLPEPVVGFGCHSWLMDTQLTRYLSEKSNIMRFQRRFSHFSDRERADWAPIEHVFHRRFDGPSVPEAFLDELPRDTSLQRGVVDHLRSGGHWYNQTGWIRAEAS